MLSTYSIPYKIYFYVREGRIEIEELIEAGF